MSISTHQLLWNCIDFREAGKLVSMITRYNVSDDTYLVGFPEEHVNAKTGSDGGENGQTLCVFMEKEAQSNGKTASIDFSNREFC